MSKKSEFTLFPIESPSWYYNFHGEVDGIKTETKMNFKRLNKNRKYIKILAICLTYASPRVIYPNTKQPLMHQVRDLCRLGYLERFKRVGDRKYYYKTTRKGQDLIIKALEVE